MVDVVFRLAEIGQSHCRRNVNWGAVETEVPEDPGGRVCSAVEVGKFRASTGVDTGSVKSYCRADGCCCGNRFT